jgi:Pyruvate/2-oxoacid:ferredoxin oxidoreductase gamma subunit
VIYHALDQEVSRAMSKTINIVLQGIGGQGTLTLMEMLAMAAEKADEEVRVLSRVSLARLGGSGMCHVRLGPSASPAIPQGEADILVSLEMSEVLRALPLARPGALALVHLYRRLPIATGTTGQHYPTRAEVEEALQAYDIHALFVPEEISFAAGEGVINHAPTPLRTTQATEHQREHINIIMLGVLCGYTRILPRPLLEEAISERLPDFAEQNARIFDAGWRFGASRAPARVTLKASSDYPL